MKVNDVRLNKLIHVIETYREDLESLYKKEKAVMPKADSLSIDDLLIYINYLHISAIS